MSLESAEAARKAKKAGRPLGRKAAFSPEEKAARLPRLAYSIREVMAMTGWSKTYTLGLISDGTLPATKIGHRVNVNAQGLIALLTKGNAAAE